MCEINVTQILFEDCSLLSASAAELGANAGQITWTNCMALAARFPLVTDANRTDIREHFADYGAWSDEEINAWTDQELSALVWQEAAADMRHFEDYCGSDVASYERDCESGHCSGRLYLESPRGAQLYPSAAYIYLGV